MSWRCLGFCLRPNAMRVGVALVVCLVMTSAAYAYKFGDFPGKGSQSIWLKANEVLNRGLAKARAGKFDEAIPIIQQAISIYPYDGKYAFNIGVCFEDRGRPGDILRAKDYYKRSTELAPDDWEAWNALARAQFQLKDYARARSSFERALMVAPAKEIPDLKADLATTTKRLQSASSL